MLGDALEPLSSLGDSGGVIGRDPAFDAFEVGGGVPAACDGVGVAGSAPDESGNVATIGCSAILTF